MFLGSVAILAGRPLLRLHPQMKRRSAKSEVVGNEAAPSEGPPSKRGKRADAGTKAGAKAGQAAAEGKPARDKAKAAPIHHDFYLMKSEPDEFSMDKLAAMDFSPWDGVRNAQARNIMQGMRKGQRAFFYHSSCKVPGIVGEVEIVREAYPDHTAWDPQDKHFDPRSSEEEPRWFMVDVRLVRKLRRPITLEELKSHKDGGLKGMPLFTMSRLSVQPVARAHWEFIASLEDLPAPTK